MISNNPNNDNDSNYNIKINVLNKINNTNIIGKNEGELSLENLVNKNVLISEIIKSTSQLEPGDNYMFFKTSIGKLYIPITKLSGGFNDYVYHSFSNKTEEKNVHLDINTYFNRLYHMGHTHNKPYLFPCVNLSKDLSSLSSNSSSIFIKYTPAQGNIAHGAAGIILDYEGAYSSDNNNPKSKYWGCISDKVILLNSDTKENFYNNYLPFEMVSLQPSTTTSNIRTRLFEYGLLGLYGNYTNQYIIDNLDYYNVNFYASLYNNNKPMQQKLNQFINLRQKDYASPAIYLDKKFNNGKNDAERMDFLLQYLFETNNLLDPKYNPLGFYEDDEKQKDIASSLISQLNTSYVYLSMYSKNLFCTPIHSVKTSDHILRNKYNINVKIKDKSTKPILVDDSNVIEWIRDTFGQPNKPNIQIARPSDRFLHNLNQAALQFNKVNIDLESKNSSNNTKIESDCNNNIVLYFGDLDDLTPTTKQLKQAQTYFMKRMHHKIHRENDQTFILYSNCEQTDHYIFDIAINTAEFTGLTKEEQGFVNKAIVIGAMISLSARDFNAIITYIQKNYQSNDNTINLATIEMKKAFVSSFIEYSLQILLTHVIKQLFNSRAGSYKQFFLLFRASTISQYIRYIIYKILAFEGAYASVELCLVEIHYCKYTRPPINKTDDDISIDRTGTINININSNNNTLNITKQQSSVAATAAATNNTTNNNSNNNTYSTRSKDNIIKTINRNFK